MASLNIVARKKEYDPGGIVEKERDCRILRFCVWHIMGVLGADRVDLE
jgi:hypothetical protein